MEWSFQSKETTPRHRLGLRRFQWSSQGNVTNHTAPIASGQYISETRSQCPSRKTQHRKSWVWSWSHCINIFTVCSRFQSAYSCMFTTGKVFSVLFSTPLLDFGVNVKPKRTNFATGNWNLSSVLSSSFLSHKPVEAFLFVLEARVLLSQHLQWRVLSLVL